MPDSGTAPLEPRAGIRAAVARNVRALPSQGGLDRSLLLTRVAAFGSTATGRRRALGNAHGRAAAPAVDGRRRYGAHELLRTRCPHGIIDVYMMRAVWVDLPNEHRHGRRAARLARGPAADQRALGGC